MKTLRWLLVPGCALLGGTVAAVVVWLVWRGIMLLGFHNGWFDPDNYRLVFAAPGADVFWVVLHGAVAFAFVWCGAVVAPAGHRRIAKWSLFALALLILAGLYQPLIITVRSVSGRMAWALGASIAVLLCGGTKTSDAH